MMLIDILNDIKARDEAFVTERIKTSGATFCVECKANKPTALTPFWHAYRRSLCVQCGVKYTAFLKANKAYDDNLIN